MLNKAKSSWLVALRNSSNVHSLIVKNQSQCALQYFSYLWRKVFQILRHTIRWVVNVNNQFRKPVELTAIKYVICGVHKSTVTISETNKQQQQQQKRLQKTTPISLRTFIRN